MEILYIAHGGFGDVSYSTAWPRLWAEKGHVIDIFLMQFTGNPFNANPYIRNIFIYPDYKSGSEIGNVLKEHNYDKIIVIENSNTGLKEVLEKIKDLKNVVIVQPEEITRKACPNDFHIVNNDIILPMTLPELYFSESEIKFVRDRFPKDGIIINPLSSDCTETSRNIDFSVVRDCSKIMNNVIMAHGGKTYKNQIIEAMEKDGIKSLWEGYNCFNDDTGSTLGKNMALISTCRVSIHGLSGSFLIAAGFNKPFIMVMPKNTVRCNCNCPYVDVKLDIDYTKWILKKVGFKGCQAWCIAEKAEIIKEAVDIVLSGKSGIFDKTWTFFE
jgi:hypothetical protein